jgi:hypothetical protein
MDLRQRLRGSAGLIAALAAGGLLLALPPAAQGHPSAPASLSLAWPTAAKASLPATLADGTAYEPDLFVDAKTSVGVAPSKDGRTVRLLVRDGAGRTRALRSLPAAQNPSYQSVTVAKDAVAWFERTDAGGLQLWTASLAKGGAHRLTGDTGLVRFYRSENDLVLAEGRVRWVASGPRNSTEVRSVALTGGAVDVRAQSGSWRFAGWPWLVDGATNTAGATTLRNLSTGQDVPVTRTRKAETACSPQWCQVVSLDGDGYGHRADAPRRQRPGGRRR